MKRCLYCERESPDDVFHCRQCGAALSRPAAAAPSADIAVAEAPAHPTSEPAGASPRPAGVPGNLGSSLLGAGVLMILAGRLFGQTLMSMGWLSAFIGLVVMLKGKSGKVRYGGAFLMSMFLLAVLMPEKEEPEPAPAAGAAEQGVVAPSHAGTAPSRAAPVAVTQVAVPPVPAAPVPAPAQPASRRKTIGLSYAKVMRYLSNTFAMEASTPVDGLDRYMGKSEAGLAILEVIGDKRDIVQATLILAMPGDAPDALTINAAILMRFLKNTFPRWKNADTRVIAILRKLLDAGESERSITRGKRALDVQLLADMGMVTLTVRHKDDR